MGTVGRYLALCDPTNRHLCWVGPRNHGHWGVALLKWRLGLALRMGLGRHTRAHPRRDLPRERGLWEVRRPRLGPLLGHVLLVLALGW